MHIHQSLVVLPGIGLKTAKKLEKLGIFTVKDLLLYYPFRYEEFKSKNISDLKDGEKAVISGVVMTSANVSYYGFRRSRLYFLIKKGALTVEIKFFNQPYLANKVVCGEVVSIFGIWHQKNFSVTGLKILAPSENSLQPVYHLARGISQRSLARMIRSAFDLGFDLLFEENLPQLLLDKYQLMPRSLALRSMHFPTNCQAFNQALHRIKFEELFYFQMNLQVLKLESKSVDSRVQFSFDEEKLEHKIDTLPFILTRDQRRSLNEILEDMRSPTHMNRLLQGDVGSGKTVVAGLAMYASYLSGMQSVMMAPTEILAEQHYESLSKIFPELSIALLTGGMRASIRRLTIDAIKSGEINLVVGTHSLIQDTLSYHKLGLVIIDEQHRFGVEQRRILREKGSNPDILMMTATPIPRTLLITVFGDIDTSTISEMPVGRKPVITRWMKNEKFPSILEWLKGELSKKVQIYFVSPLIKASAVLDFQSAISLKKELSVYFGDTINVALLHGKMKNEEKDIIMKNFRGKEIDILVSTNIIEVGIDVPNATIMVIMDAHRFGLSQLHQLRGRVGRGDKQSYVILLSDPKTELGKVRMKIITEITNGLTLAEEDLKMRGSGEIFGIKQSGVSECRVADFVKDRALLEETKKVSCHILSDPNWDQNVNWQPIPDNLKVSGTLD